VRDVWGTRQSLNTAYTYDVLNRLSTLAFNGQTPAFGFGYDALSRRTSLTRPNGVNATYAYDPQSRLTSILHKLGTTTLDGATYTYDNAGNRKTRTDKRLTIRGQTERSPVFLPIGECARLTPAQKVSFPPASSFLVRFPHGSPASSRGRRSPPPFYPVRQGPPNRFCS
jgi:YD repeat-containing protein